MPARRFTGQVRVVRSSDGRWYARIRRGSRTLFWAGYFYLADQARDKARAWLDSRNLVSKETHTAEQWRRAKPPPQQRSLFDDNQES